MLFVELFFAAIPVCFVMALYHLLRKSCRIDFKATEAMVVAQEAEAAQRAKDNDRSEYAVRKRLNEERSKSASFYRADTEDDTKEDKTKDWLSTD
ncbi:MAG: hypothetical protein LBU73_09595 [Helicobacteraceae bacterium]|nr:hypothetical protein [Helicobacteraceae bacterium]